MSWKWLTGVLFATCIAIYVWMYVRDKSTPLVSRPVSVAAQADGARLLSVLVSRPTCGSQCGVDVYGSSSADRWRVMLTGSSWQRCFVITPREFSYAEARGFRGVASVSCPA